MRNDILIRPETRKDYKYIISLVLGSFGKGTGYSDGTGELALIEEIRGSEYYVQDLSFVAELDGEIVGHFMFSKFPLSSDKDGARGNADESGIVMLAPVAVHPEHFRQGVGTAMLTQGIEAVRKAGYRGITVEGDFNYYNRLGFRTSSELGIYPTCGYPMEEPRCMMCMETYPGSLAGIGGYVVYDMYCNA